jgi:hypothetical protein
LPRRRPQNDQRRETGQQPPEGRTDAGQSDARGGDQESQQGGFAFGFLAEGAGETAADRAEQGEAGDGQDQFLREGQEKRADRGPEKSDQQIEDAGGDGGDVTFLGVRALRGPCRWPR